MITTEYVLTLAVALMCCLVLMALRMPKRGLKPNMVVAAIPMCAALGIGCAWVLYKALMFMMPVSSFGYSFIGGVLGVILGIAISAVLFRQPVRQVLDAGAAPICLMVCIARLGEHFLKNVGWGRNLAEGSWLCRFPFAVPVVWDEWFTEWYAAIYMLEALFALIAMVVTFALFNPHNKVRGLAFERSMYLLIVPQILCEQLRSMPMAWGFVKAEQIVCGVLAAFLLGRSCYKWAQRSRHATFVKTWWPIAALLACVGVIMACEFALDGKIEWPVMLSWCLFGASLVAMLALEAYAVRRRIRTVRG